MAGADDKENQTDSHVLTAKAFPCISRPSHESGSRVHGLLHLLFRWCVMVHVALTACAERLVLRQKGWKKDGKVLIQPDN